MAYFYLNNLFLLKPASIIYLHPCTMNEQNYIFVTGLLVHQGNHEAYWSYTVQIMEMIILNLGFN